MDRIERQGLKNLKDRLSLTVICGSCGGILRRGDPGKVTPGICPPCYKDLTKDLNTRGTAVIEKPLNKIGAAEAKWQQMNIFGPPFKSGGDAK